MNVEIGTEAPQFPEKEYLNGIFVAVWFDKESPLSKWIWTRRNPPHPLPAPTQKLGKNCMLSKDDRWSIVLLLYCILWPSERRVANQSVMNMSSLLSVPGLRTSGLFTKPTPRTPPSYSCSLFPLNQKRLSKSASIITVGKGPLKRLERCEVPLFVLQKLCCDNVSVE